MKTPQDLNARRDIILDQMTQLRRIRRGTITTSRPVRKLKDGTTHQAGPYFKHQCWKEGRNQTVYLSAEEYARLQPDVENYHTLLTLTEELAEINERLTLLEQTDSVLQEKKTTLPKPPKRN